MPSPRKKCEKHAVRRKFLGNSLTTQAGHLASVFLRLTLFSLIFLSLQNIGEGLDFCFDGTKEGRFF